MPDDDESALIQTLTAPQGAVAGLRVGNGDDAVVLDDGWAITVDTMVEGVHWDGRLSAEDVGWKLVMVNASDLDACGASPTFALLALSLPAPLDRTWAEDFSRGLHTALREVGAALIGGDTTRSPGPRCCTLTMLGRAPPAPLTRTGARAGDDLWVSGTLGDAAAGFALADPPAPLLQALRRPRPPLGLGPALVGVATAAMDLSDGLCTDLGRLTRAAGVGAEVWPEALPRSATLAALGQDPLAWQVAFGEDYQLLFTAPPAARERIAGLGSQLGVPLSRVGRVVPGDRPQLVGRTWPATWQHFPGDS